MGYAGKNAVEKPKAVIGYPYAGWRRGNSTLDGSPTVDSSPGTENQKNTDFYYAGIGQFQQLSGAGTRSAPSFRTWLPAPAHLAAQGNFDWGFTTGKVLSEPDGSGKMTTYFTNAPGQPADDPRFNLFQLTTQIPKGFRKWSPMGCRLYHRIATFTSGFGTMTMRFGFEIMDPADGEQWASNPSEVHKDVQHTAGAGAYTESTYTPLIIPGSLLNQNTWNEGDWLQMMFYAKTHINVDTGTLDVHWGRMELHWDG
jgi:hypothetical protein